MVEVDRKRNEFCDVRPRAHAGPRLASNDLESLVNITLPLLFLCNCGHPAHELVVVYPPLPQSASQHVMLPGVKNVFRSGRVIIMFSEREQG